jgi:hypothetical protein
VRPLCVQGLCMRYCLEAGALPRELRACLLAIETLLTSAHFATPAHRLSSVPTLPTTAPPQFSSLLLHSPCVVCAVCQNNRSACGSW